MSRSNNLLAILMAVGILAICEADDDRMEKEKARKYDDLYPDWRCHKGFDFSEDYDTVRDESKLDIPLGVKKMLQSVKYCRQAESHETHQTCFKHCIMGAYRIVDEHLPGLPMQKSDISREIELGFDGDTDTPQQIADNITSQCGELGKNVPAVVDTTPDCEGLEEFHKCVENAWKC